jgi:pimeloyl-ACP methyl ester carboxylesterase
VTELGYERRLREWVSGQGFDWRRLSAPRPSGTAVGYRISPGERVRGTVVLVHGAGNDALFAMSSTVRRLVSAGFEVLTFDVDGHGRSSTTTFSATEVESFVPAIVRARGAGDHRSPVHLLGISFGGALALHAAARIRVASVTIVATPLSLAVTRRSVLREIGPRSLLTLIRERADYGLTGLIPAFGPFKRSLYPVRLTGGDTGRLSYLDRLDEALRALCLEDTARRVAVPTLLVYGSRDLTAPPAHGERLRRALPDATLRVMDGETHLSTPLARRTLDAVVGWVEANTPRRTPSEPVR